MAFATWNPSDKDGDVALSNGNLTATNATAGGTVRATIGITNTKNYWEVTIGSTANTIRVGIINDTGSLVNYCGFTASARSYGSDGKKYNNNVGTAYGATYTTGDVIGVAFDRAGGRIEFFKNGVSQGVAFLFSPGAIYHPAWGPDSSGASDSGTANFGETAFAFSVPSGYLSGVFDTRGELNLTGNSPVVKNQTIITPGTGSLLIPPIAVVVTSQFTITLNSSALSLIANTPGLGGGCQPGTGALTITGPPSTVSINYAVSVGVGSVSITGLAPVVIGGQVITPTTGSLNVAVVAPVQGVSVSTWAGAVSITGGAPAQGSRISTGQGLLALSGAVSNLGLVIVTQSGAITLSGIAPALIGSQVRSPGSGTLSLTVSSPVQGAVIATLVGAIVISGNPPQISAFGLITPDTGALNLTGASPAIAWTNTPVSGQLSLAGQQASLGTAITPNSGTISLTGLVPGVGRGITPSPGVAVLQGQSPVIHGGVGPSAGSISLTGQNPGVLVNMLPAAGSGSLNLSGFVTVLGLGITPGTGQIAVVGVSASTGSSVSPGAGVIGVVGFVPQVITQIAPIVPFTGSLVMVGDRPEFGMFKDGVKMVWVCRTQRNSWWRITKLN